MDIDITLDLAFHQLSRADLADSLGWTDGARNALIAGDPEAGLRALDELTEAITDIEVLYTAGSEPIITYEINDPSDDHLLSEGSTAAINVRLSASEPGAQKLIEWAQAHGETPGESSTLFARAILAALTNAN